MTTLHNTLTKTVEEFTPLASDAVSIYTCGPTVYDHAHIGNLSAFIVADTLRRSLAASGARVTHVMNFTDVDDKTIRRSRDNYPELDAMRALRTLTEEYGKIFIDDMEQVGNDTGALTFIKAADEATIEGMRQLITELHAKGFAYIADDGVYFSIDAYKKSGKIYGQLVEITEASTGNERIQNDEYDKESAHDFALWKTKKPGEPAWEFTIDGRDMTGRPGWHIECSVMSRMKLGQPFDIHTGGIDLAFPHHENEIAQSTAGKENPVYAGTFVHNEHILVDGKKMSKSLGNFYTLKDLIEKGVEPLAFRMLVLQSHYRKQTNFSFAAIESATNRLRNWRDMATLRHQVYESPDIGKSSETMMTASSAIIEALNDDLNTPEALRIIDETFGSLPLDSIDFINRGALVRFIETIDQVLGLKLLASTPDISDDAKQLILERERAREDKDWAKSDELRDIVTERFAVVLRDTPNGTVWAYS